MNNLITITSLRNLNHSTLVDNFSDQNVKQAIKNLLGIAPKHLQCVQCNTTSSRYGILASDMKKYPKLADKIKSLSFGEYALIIEVSYSELKSFPTKF